jgi:site-specific DNA-methyltransferase (adenine-specific)
VQTKFFHFLLTLRKNTQHATSGTYKYIPIQDFNEAWNDEKLYSKYNLNKDEIDLIEGMVSEKISNNELSKG